jgi:hypothetical protein
MRFEINAAFSVVLGGHYPVGEIPRPEIEQAAGAVGLVVDVTPEAEIGVSASGFVPYRIGEKAAGITNAFSCFTTTPGGFRAGHCPPAEAAARTLKRSLASL